MNDAELVARAREGDDSAFGDLVERHRSAVFRTALAILGDATDADDVAQEVFVTAHRRLATFRGEAGFKTWLLAIAWNQAINRRRSVVRMVKRLVTIEAAETDASSPMALVSRGSTPEQSVVDGALRQAVIAEIRRLSPKLRDALLLAQSGDHTYEEIAAITGTPTGTIKWRVSEARRVVRKRLRERGYDDV